MEIVTSPKAMQRWADGQRAQGRRIGFVPTMGYLHQGHLELVRVARAHSDVLVVSIFVNPLQFGPGEDFERYPRDFERDQQLLAEADTDIIYYPSALDLYPPDFSTHVSVAGLTQRLCGASRPGHFTGVTTVVAKLFNAVKPHVAVFGAKDAQQAAVIRRMVRDLDFDIEIIVVPTVREPDGLAMSSRNSYLSPAERQQAPVLYQALRHGANLIARGERSSRRIIAEITKMIEQAGGRIDYVSIVDPDQLQEVDEITGPALIAVAVFFGKTRLIDNITVNP